MNKYQAILDFVILVNENGGWYEWDQKSNYIVFANGKKELFKNIDYFKAINC